MNKKGSAWIWVTFGFIFLIIIIITILIISNQNSEKKESEENVGNLNIYLMAKDSKYQISLSGKYTILNGSKYIQNEIIKDTFNQIKNVSNKELNLLCESSGFYSYKINRNFTEQEKSQNASKINCYLDKIGTIKIDSTGELKEGQSQTNLVILAKDYYKGIQICTAWSSGVINIETNYNESEIPKRYDGLVDKCFNINKSIKDGAITIPFNIKSSILNKNDFITFYIMDSDISYDGSLNNFYTEYNGINLGDSEDKIYALKYQDG